MKKTLAILCAVALCLCSMPFFAVAADEPAKPNNFVTMVDPNKVDLTEKAQGGNHWKIWTDNADAKVENGMIHAAVDNNSWVEFKTEMVHYDSKGGVDKALKGMTTAFDTAGKNGISFNDQESGIAFRLKASNLATKEFTFYIKTYNPDAPKKVDLVKASFAIDVAEDGSFDDWVYIPMYLFDEHLWDGQDGDAPAGFFKTDCVLWFMIESSMKSVDGEPVDMSVGEIGLFGAAMQGSANFPGLDADGNAIAPEKLVTLIDFSKTTDLTEFNVENADGTSYSKVEDGALHLVMPEDDNYGWWWQNGADFHVLDDETGEPISLRPGFTDASPCYDEKSDKAGLAFYVDATGLGGSKNLSEPFTVTLMICEWDYDENGEQVLGADKEPKGTWYSIPANIPSGYKGWITVPFSKVVKNAWEGSDFGTKFDGKHIGKVVFWGSVSHDDGIAGEMDLKIGNVGVWGEAEAVEEKPADKPAEKPENNPNSGMTAATGIASGVAIAALTAAAVVCFRKKED